LCQLSKFVESDMEKTDRAVELYVHYAEQLRDAEQRYGTARHARDETPYHRRGCKLAVVLQGLLDFHMVVCCASTRSIAAPDVRVKATRGVEHPGWWGGGGARGRVVVRMEVCPLGRAVVEAESGRCGVV
jgi:hypothetical protein